MVLFIKGGRHAGQARKTDKLSHLASVAPSIRNWVETKLMVSIFAMRGTYKTGREGVTRTVQLHKEPNSSCLKSG